MLNATIIYSHRANHNFPNYFGKIVMICEDGFLFPN